MIQLYLHMDMFSTGHADGALTTDAPNAARSCVWEFQLCLVVKDRSLHFLFENKGDLYNGHGFKMLAALDQHCRPKSVSNAFGCLMSLFNDVQEDNESIWEYHYCFDGFVNDLSHSKVAIPPVLIVMLFLHTLHGPYSELLDQYRTRFRSLKTATVDSVVKDVQYLDSFTLHNYKHKSKSPTRILAAATANTDKEGKVWQSPFAWLNQAYGKKGIRTCWT
jgi:hypothetical protein